MTERYPDDADVSRLLAVDPEQLSRDALVNLVRALQGHLAVGNPAPNRSAGDPPRSPARAVTGADYTIVFDGGSLGNPGLGYGSYEIVGNGSSTAAQRLEFGHGMTNNQAEFHALIAALENLLAMTGPEAATTAISVRGDSQLVIRGLKGEWRIKHPGLQPLFRQATDLLRRFSSVDLAWHPRRESVRTFGH